MILLIISKDLIRYATCSIPRELCTYTSVQLGLKLVCLTMDDDYLSVITLNLAKCDNTVSVVRTPSVRKEISARAGRLVKLA